MADYFIKIGSHKGESKDSKHVDWIDILSWSVGASQAASAHTGGGAGSANVMMQDFSFTKHLDLSTNPLFLELCKGTHIKEIKFHARKAGGDPFNYMEYTFTDSILSHYSTGGSGDYPTESWGFSFAKVAGKYDLQGDKGKSAGGNNAWYDMKTKTGG